MDCLVLMFWFGCLLSRVIESVRAFAIVIVASETYLYGWFHDVCMFFGICWPCVRPVNVTYVGKLTTKTKTILQRIYIANLQNYLKISKLK